MTPNLRHPAFIVRSAVEDKDYPRIRAAFNRGAWTLNFSIVVIENEPLTNALEQWRTELDMISAPWKTVSIDLVVGLRGLTPKSHGQFGLLLSELFEELKGVSPDEVMTYRNEPLLFSLGGLRRAEIELGYGDGLSMPIKDGIVPQILKKYENMFKTLGGIQSPLTIEFRLN